MNEILAKPIHAIVATNRPGRAPQLTPVWFYWDGERFYFSTTRDRAKYPNIKRDPSVALIVDDFETHHYIAAYGKAEIIEENVLDTTRPIVSRYLSGDALAQFEAGAMGPDRVVVALKPEKLVTR
jgi:PPOX class probable F420-dependent enzyme